MYLEKLNVEDVEYTEDILIEALRDVYPKHDLRIGTAIRDLVIRPAATLCTHIDDITKELSKYTTLIGMDDVDIESINKVLSNFNTSYRGGSKSTGYIRMMFSDGATRIVPRGYIFTYGELRFKTLDAVVVSESGGTGVAYDVFSSDGKITYSVPIAVESEIPGANNNLPTGISFGTVAGMIGLITSYSISSFVGGTDGETIEDIIARLPEAIASRSLSNKLSMKAMLTDRFGETIQGVSLEGLGSKTQKRNRSIGLAVGGYVDAYVRTFRNPISIILRKEGTVTDNGKWGISLSKSEAAGVYAIKSVTKWDGKYAPSGTTASSYAINYTRKLSSDTGGHNIPDVPSGSLSSYQEIDIEVNDALATVGNPPEYFKVEVLAAPLIREIQEFCDSPINRNVGVDMVVKSPTVAMVSMTVTVYVPDNSEDTEDSIRYRVTEYINSQSFTDILRLSEIIQTIGYKVDMPLNTPVLRVDVHGSDGSKVTYSSSSDIDIKYIDNPDKCITNNTTVFSADPSDIHINIIRI